MEQENLKPEILIEIEDIMNNFDFRKIHHYMEEVHWRWANCGIPPVEILRKKVREGLEYVIRNLEDKEYFKMDTGGFYIEARQGDEARPVNLRVMFCIEEWGTF